MTAELASATPRLAIVIPIYRHSALVIEAIESVLAQRFEGGLHLVLVSDGCPMPETDQVCREYAHAYPELVSYLRKRNGGLSDARNFGIRHALKRFPSVEAIYMLDADNRLRPDAMARAMAVLDAEPDVDWVYPNIDMFGLEWQADLSGEYSELIHTEINICEAGSLIRKRVFEKVLFDTNFKLGWEDWEFFLNAAQAGFRGKNLEHFGFLYRKRPESMLADSTRSQGALESQLRQKHKEHSNPKRLLELEHATAPRYAIHLSDHATTLSCVDPSDSGCQKDPFHVVDKKIWRALAAPNAYRVPPINIFTTTATFSTLCTLGQIHPILWKVESLLERHGIVALTITGNADSRLAYVEHIDSGKSGLHKQAVLLAMSSELLKDVLRDSESLWIDSLMQPVCMPSVCTLELSVPNRLYGISMAKRPTAVTDLLAFVHRLRSSQWRDSAFHTWGFRTKAIPWRGAEHKIVRKRTANAPVYPRIGGQERHIGFILPLAEFGGVEKVALHMARAMRAYGWVPHAFILDSPSMHYSCEWQNIFESTTLLNAGEFKAWDFNSTQSYLGTGVPNWAQHGNHGPVVGMLCWLDAVANFQCGGVVGVMGQLRRLGVTTINSLHLNELSPLGRHEGNVHLGIAYEHAFDYFVPCSNQLGDWLHGMGVPRAKIIPVPNAPGFELSKERVERSLLTRRHRSADAPLRALYLGRLDRQKGLDRLTEVIRRTEMEALNVEWRVVGQALMAEGAPAIAPEVARYLEPAVTRPGELAKLYDWADVVVLLSSYEGLPLTILEAMRQGCVPVATDVGAVSEALINGQTGVLLSSETAVTDCMNALRQLSTNRQELKRLSTAAAGCMEGRTWEEAVTRLVEQLDKHTAKAAESNVQVSCDTELPRDAGAIFAARPMSESGEYYRNKIQ